MTSRKTIVALAALGAFAVPAGPAVAQTTGGDSNAAGAQYESEQQRTEQIAPQPPQPPQPPAPQQEVLPAQAAPRDRPHAAAEVTPVVQPGAAAAVPASPGGQLPFTGYDVMAVVAGGLTLLAAGLLLRRRTRGST
jgi:hypothetical protein